MVRALTFVLFFSTLRAGAAESSLLAQLEAKFTSEHLMIAGVMSRDLMVFPFSADPFIRRFFEFDFGLARPAPDGTAVLGYSDSANPGLPARRLALVSVDGRVLALLDRDIVNVEDLAVASDHVSVAFAAKDRQTNQVGIFSGKLGTPDARLIVPLRSREGVPQETSIGWAPDAKAIVFSLEDDIWTYNLSSGQRSLLFRGGTHPSCSPDGQWLGYRDSDGFAMIAPKGDAKARRASRSPIDGGVHWSPDSAYYFVNEQVPDAPPRRCAFGNCFVVYRLSDGSRLELQGTVRKDSFFGWLLGPWITR